MCPYCYIGVSILVKIGFQNITPLPSFLRGNFKNGVLFLGSWIELFILFDFYFILILIFFSSLQTRSSEIQQQNSKNTVQILTQYVYIPRVFGMYTLGLRVVCIIIRNTQNNVTIYLTTPSSSKKHSKHSIRHSKIPEYLVTNCILRCKYG